MIRRGDIRWFRFAAPDKRRPVLVVGRDDALPALAQVPVIPMSTQERSLQWKVPLSEVDGLPSKCVLKPEWIRIVERRHLGPWIASLPAERWPEVRAAVLGALGFEE